MPPHFYATQQAYDASAAELRNEVQERVSVLALSPKGERVAFVARGADQKPRIYVRALESQLHLHEPWRRTA